MTTSRRSARYSIGERENDALFEFENFKKKFLLANKHITKLNSTLSLRIEDLNAQITALQAENLVLRQSHCALERQLKSEKEKSRHVMLNAENAVNALVKHFGAMRVRFDVPASVPQSPPKKHKDKKPLSPVVIEKDRLAKIPDEPGIAEDDEPSDDAPASEVVVLAPPVPKTATKTKPLRRQSAMFSNPDPPRTASPPPVSIPDDPVRQARATPLVEDDDEPLLVPQAPPKPKEKEKRRSVTPIGSSDSSEDGVGRGRKIQREPLTLKNITNSPSRKAAKPHRAAEDENVPSLPVQVPRKFLAEIPSSSGNSSLVPKPPSSSSTAVKRPISPPPSPSPPPRSEPTPPDTPAPTASRSTRTNRKSVNYAEPKLNTKMRKPDPTPEESTKTKEKEARRAKRASAAAALPSVPSTHDLPPARKSSPRHEYEQDDDDYDIPPPPPSQPHPRRTSSEKPRSSGSSRASESPPTASSTEPSPSPSPPLPAQSSATTQKIRKSRAKQSLSMKFLDDEELESGDEGDEEYAPWGSGVTAGRRRRTLPVA